MADKTRCFVVQPSIRKKFDVGETTVRTSTPLNNSASGKLKRMIKTRPKACPVCRTEDKITKNAASAWQCKECGHEWI